MASSFLWHTQEADSVAHELKTDLEQGLSNKEAASRLIAYGLNKLPETTHSLWQGVFFRQQISLMIPVLLLASAMLIIAGLWSGAFVVIGILVINVILSGFQTIRSEQFLRSLRELTNRLMYARVFRSGRVKLVEVTALVPGDIICFEIGDLIAADGRLIEANNLTIDESLIMRVSLITEKGVDTLGEDTPIHQRKNMVFMGTTPASGSGRAVVTSTGTQTQLAQMSKGQQTEKSHWSLLESNISKKGLRFAGGCVVFSVVLWAAMMLAGVPPLAGFMVSLSVLVAAWPMGLIEAVIMALAVGIKRLGERGVIVKRLSGAEALAEATVICSDKAGLMTQKQMTVKKVFVDGRIIDIEGDGYDPESGSFPPGAEDENPDLPLLLTVAAMCANTEVKNTPEGWNVTGDPTEGALIVAAIKGGINKDEIGLSLTKVVELPFDSERKRMSIVFKSSKDELFVFTRGSLETVLDISNGLQLHGYMDTLDIGKQRAIWAVKHSFAKNGMQSLAFAYCQLEEEPEEYTIQTLERNLIFIGMAGIVDPLRADAKRAVQKCLAGAVKPVIFTDDHIDTTAAIAFDLGMVKDGSETLSGEELDILGEKEYSSLAGRFSAYADVLPVHKLRIIRTLRSKGAITAVVGNHTNDAPVIAEADIGIVAGQTAASIATDAADILLMDNSFATAVDAVAEMRGSYGNAMKIIRYLLSGSVTVVTAILIALIISIFQRNFFPPPSAPYMVFLHVLWINLLAGGIPVLAMVFSPVTDGTMKDGPYLCGRIFANGLKSKILIRGILTAFLVLTAYAFSLGSQMDQSRAMTAALTVLVTSHIVFAFQCRRTSDEGFFRKYLTNKLLLGFALFAILLHISVVYIPAVSHIFGTEPLMLRDWIPILVALVICSFPLDELLEPRGEEEPENQESGEPDDGKIVDA